MIYYLVMQRQTNAMQSFLSSWGGALAERVRVIPYESILAGDDVPGRGTYIFSNINAIRRLPDSARARIQGLHDELAAANGARKVLNNPARSLSRYELLRELHARGLNDFDVYRVGMRGVPRRYPVFIRNAGGPEWQAPPLLRDVVEYQAAVMGLNWRRRGALDELIAVELCDTSGGKGVFRKYGAFVVRDAVVPRHLLFSRTWMVKLAELVEPAMVEEELAYMRDNPHAAALLERARLAGIDYGRIDYAMKGDRLQVWEINTNSMITMPMGTARSVRDDVQRQFVPMMTRALLALDTDE
jgi:hypothetical protein